MVLSMIRKSRYKFMNIRNLDFNLFFYIYLKSLKKTPQTSISSFLTTKHTDIITNLKPQNQIK
jgi:hypothetical protein